MISSARNDTTTKASSPMAVGRRVFLGAFTAGAVTVAAGSEASAADDEYTQYTAPAKFYGDSPTAYVVAINYKATSGDKAALNVTSDNPASSAMYISGKEQAARGTLKIAHVGYADGSDSGASGLSIDLQTPGTAAQGIYVTATQGPTKGALLVLRNNAGLEDFVVKGTGLIGVGIDRGGTAKGQLHVVQRTKAPALAVEGVTHLADVGTPPAKLEEPGLGGGLLYAEGGALKWRSSQNKVTTIAPA
ncbi:hyaluronoglucosaminidase [Streptomyces sp. NPDC002328]|uniref:hyaluronoglucosaminidase n=1 Tax=Streptomyces sp. NPDC002328 TaxID=3364642 RepID=UPI0036991641